MAQTLFFVNVMRKSQFILRRKAGQVVLHSDSVLLAGAYPGSALALAAVDL